MSCVTLGKPLNLSEFSCLILPDGSHSPWPSTVQRSWEISIR